MLTGKPVTKELYSMLCWQSAQIASLLRQRQMMAGAPMPSGRRDVYVANPKPCGGTNSALRCTNCLPDAFHGSQVLSLAGVDVMEQTCIVVFRVCAYANACRSHQVGSSWYGQS